MFFFPKRQIPTELTESKVNLFMPMTKWNAVVRQLCKENWYKTLLWFCPHGTRKKSRSASTVKGVKKYLRICVYSLIQQNAEESQPAWHFFYDCPRRNKSWPGHKDEGGIKRNSCILSVHFFFFLLLGRPLLLLPAPYLITSHVYPVKSQVKRINKMGCPSKWNRYHISDQMF